MKCTIFKSVRARQKERAEMGFWGLALPLCASLGCEAQVSGGYTGEPLLSMQGTVVLTEPRSGDLVPALAFRSTLIDPEVRGTFPAEVRLDVMEVPPESALFDFADPNQQGKVGLGRLVVVPRNHPRAVSVLPKGTAECNDDGSACISREETCDDQGRCRQRTLECTYEDCPIASQTGDPTILKEAAPHGTLASTECITESCMDAVQICRASNDCYREIRKCDLSRTNGSTTIVGGAYRTCRVSDESGDASLSPYEHLEEVALGYSVLYLTHENTSPGFGTLGPGYHLIETLQPSDPEWVGQINCEYLADISAVDAYNQEHGTSYIAHQYSEYAKDPSVAAAIFAERDRLRSECPQAVTRRVLGSPLEHRLIFKLGRAPLDSDPPVGGS